MTAPIPLNSFPEGDDDSYSWSTRLSKGGNQYLLDLMSEWQLGNKSQVLKMAVKFLYTYLPKIVEETDTKLSRRLMAYLNYAEADRLADERDSVLHNLAVRMEKIVTTDHPPLRIKLETTAKEYAAAHNISWPPPDMSLVSFDMEAKYILERILSVAGKRDTNVISCRLLLQSCHWKQEDVVPVLERLEKYEYIQLTREKRSGPLTLWITIPTLPIGKSKKQSQIIDEFDPADAF